jgi:hypothetical protein
VHHNPPGASLNLKLPRKDLKSGFPWTLLHKGHENGVFSGSLFRISIKRDVSFTFDIVSESSTVGLIRHAAA